MQTAPPGEDLRPWFLTTRDVADGIDPATFFDADRPLELDIGCGRGGFLVRAAEESPDRNWLGLEIDYREGRRTAKRLKRRDWGHARVVGGDAREVLAKLLLPGSVAVAHVYFPDPWWKRKHAKRRLFTDTFVDLLDRVLGPAGEVSVRTDVPEYFERVRGLMDHDKRFSRLFVTREELSPEEVATSFERKAREQNTVIDCGRWRRA